MILSLALLFAGEVMVLRPAIEPDRLASWRAAIDERPSLRGFRAPILSRAREALVLHAVAGVDARSARTIAERLARDGLRATLVTAFAQLDQGGADRRTPAERLERAGFPLDWLDSFAMPDSEPLLDVVARELGAGRSREVVLAQIAALPFVYRPTIPGFGVATECGEHDAAALRLQISSATDYARPGEGGAMDILRDLARALPDAEIVAGVETKHLAAVERESRTLAESRAGRITLVESPLPLAQWAQDSAKAGHVESSGRRAVVWLAPRYASRGEDGTRFAPAESLALEGFSESGREVRSSRLLFQGGNLLAVRDPKSGTRSLLIGEAEIARNRALGLTRDEVLAAFRAEFGVDGCIVLPAVSFHIDLEVSVRATPDGVVAFVLDTSTAARTIIRCGIAALERTGLLDQEGARLALEDADADRHAEFFGRLGPIFQAAQHSGGRFTLDFAQKFAAGPEDSGVGNLQRFLLALDLWTAARMGDATQAELGIDTDSFAYLTSLRRREGDRTRVAAALGGLGWKLVAVPGLSDEARSLNPLNGVHLRGVYLQPVYGGIFEPLDALATQRIAEGLGSDVRILPVRCGETQRRSGGLHCAVAVEPSPRAP